MLRLRYSNWAGLLLLCAVATAFVGGLSRLATGDGGYPVYLPAIFGGSQREYLPLVDNSPLLYPYVLQPGSPTYLANFINASGCSWFGVVGRAFGPDGNPVLNLIVHLEGGGFNVDVPTGSGPAALGPGGYMIVLGDHPVETSSVYFIQVRDNAGTPLSDVYSIPTHANCKQNLVMVNFMAGLLVRPTPVPPTPVGTPPTPAGTPPTSTPMRWP